MLAVFSLFDGRAELSQYIVIGFGRLLDGLHHQSIPLPRLLHLRWARLGQFLLGSTAKGNMKMLT